jgi:hypothetical protein
VINLVTWSLSLNPHDWASQSKMRARANGKISTVRKKILEDAKRVIDTNGLVIALDS